MEEVISGATGVPTSSDVVVNGPQFTYTVPLNGGNVITSGTTVAVAAMPLTLAPSSTFVSNLIPSYGARHVAGSFEMTQVATITLNRFMDQFGSIVNAGSVITATLTANTVSNIDTADSTLWQSMNLEIVNGGTAGTITRAFLVLQS